MRYTTRFKPFGMKCTGWPRCFLSLRSSCRCRVLENHGTAAHGRNWRCAALYEQRCFGSFAGVDAPPYQSGTFDSKSRHVSKRGSPHLRSVLFTICSVILQHADPENPIYQFMDRKRAEGKYFYVYTVAGTAKFLRIYYARVKEYLNANDAQADTVA